MSKKKKERPEDEGPQVPDWIVTFSDMVSLLVTFFILLLTFSSMQEHNVLRMPRDLLGRKAVIKDPQDSSLVDPPSADIMNDVDPEGSTVPHDRDALAEGNEGIQRRPDDLELDLTQIQDGIVLQFDGQASFASGSDEPNAYLRQRLVELAEVARHYPVQVTVEGYTDDRHSPTPRFPTPEALGSGRASAAARILVDAGGLDPRHVQVAGLGARSPRTDNSTALLRTLNRRVEVRIEPAPGQEGR